MSQGRDGAEYLLNDCAHHDAKYGDKTSRYLQHLQGRTTPFRRKFSPLYWQSCSTLD
ncbi:hypothetical protein [Vibrio vulnificus YJ016]|uniref:Uncharacterized protein n=1 Tax=Vibrio vulnificus (strain YJ016) TaxID=196600 RepID=Q7MBV8_VIBVY|nr:hypothetical protein [Vibrio vulnificus YJ016]